ncbi:MAG: hypothetical protein JSR26_05180 [Proteobacteria bacterium]|nr:hypothetical protein [Pseudomonadota bacterium]
MANNKSPDKILAQRRAVAHLAKTCITHGHYTDLFLAFEIARPDLAQKHWESAGRDDALAGVHLGMGFDTYGGVETTVLDEYLFGDATRVLRLVTVLNEQWARLAALRPALTQ